MTQRPFRVLSLDGGGIRGLYTASLLQQLALRIARYHGDAHEHNLDIGKQFDLIVGTSTGSIIAVALAAGVPLERVLQLYRDECKKIFKWPMPLQMGCTGDKFKATLWALIWNARSPANKSEALREALKGVLGDETVGQLYARRRVALCVPTINAETQKGWVFKTPHLSRLTRDNNFPLVDVCMASAAAPIYFPIHSVKSPELGSNAILRFVDGGLWANDPVLTGLTEALEIVEDPSQRPIEILTVGTGGPRKSQVITDKNAKRGTFKWKGGIDITTMSLEAQASTTPYIAKQIARFIKGVKIYRLADPVISGEEAGHLALDAVDKKSLAVMEGMAQRATDVNFSQLTNSATRSAEAEMVLQMFKDVKPTGGSHGV